MNLLICNLLFAVERQQAAGGEEEETEEQCRIEAEVSPARWVCPSAQRRQVWQLGGQKMRPRWSAHLIRQFSSPLQVSAKSDIQEVRRE